ncbi:hypothetical protein BABINDRAFT_6069 [Babjeviella inositovora NRRL Y-12698]|uniref:Hyaluronan/mRNA-binding protein domain-containing protein n=1 Tax=Babjeviella inositovora NRRL Y-12698 TaxID=984486 RepID=A0A1E3R012_9ASCO|nr:uncharacterized protein BABINDRAFT_6069 [Babjeviella inositovora NRRL Y-12698]ODQ83221.1 hypothetical protein BABINDRAFT_6069 [Babjeviella inositovora NRRL Y-12698]
MRFMTHTHKWSKRPAAHYFTHNGHIDQDPHKIKKEGWGKGNWGTVGGELDDLVSTGEVKMNNPRRMSNSAQAMKTDAELTQEWEDTHSDEETVDDK